MKCENCKQDIGVNTKMYVLMQGWLISQGPNCKVFDEDEYVYQWCDECEHLRKPLAFITEEEVFNTKTIEVLNERRQKEIGESKQG